MYANFKINETENKKYIYGLIISFNSTVCDKLVLIYIKVNNCTLVCLNNFVHGLMLYGAQP